MQNNAKKIIGEIAVLVNNLKLKKNKINSLKQRKDLLIKIKK